jgi:hypothetical protein
MLCDQTDFKTKVVRENLLLYTLSLFYLTVIVCHLPPFLPCAYGQPIKCGTSIRQTLRILPLPKRVLHTLRSGVAFLNFQYRLVSLRLSSRCLRLLLRLPAPPAFPS